MSRNVKSLYKCKKFNELQNHYNVNPKYSTWPVKRVLESINKLDKEAEKYRLEGDEEMEYILRMKYLWLLQLIQHSPNFSEEKGCLKQVIGKSTVCIVLDKTEMLAKSLRERYDQLNVLELELVKARIEQDRAESRKKTAAGIMENTKVLRKGESITANELFDMIQNYNVSFLIMDCRSSNDYETSRIDIPHSVNIPEDFIVPGKSADKIQSMLSQESKIKFSSRNSTQIIILMDWNTSGPTLLSNTPIYNLSHILKNFDPDRNPEQPLLMLQGGYAKFRLLYPHQCLNPQFEMPENLNQHNNSSLDNLEYPDISKIVMKNDDSFSGSRKRPGVPSVDRSSKAEAMMIYEKKNKVELLDERKLILDKSIENEREMLKSENELEWLQIEKAKEEIEEEKKKISELQTELKYKLLECENKKRDFASEGSHLEDLLKEEDSRKITQKEAAQLEAEAIKRQEIKEKEEIARLLDEERQIVQKKREIQSKLEQAREQKAKLKENYKPKVPQFDRAAKPNLNTQPLYEYNDNIQRDFSPVRGHVGRGLTGLKNLGNTCYMNSILQVLSNTGHFNELLIEGSFQKQVNRKNETKGRVVQEVAALIKALWSGQYKYIASKNLKYVVGQYERKFNGIEQQDSHEFLTYLIDWLHSDLHTQITIFQDPSIEIPASEKAWFQFTSGKESIMTQYFYGQTKSTVKCTKCGKESATYESFSHLSLELPADSNRCSLVDCLNMYFHGEHIRGWNCPGCKSNQDAIKKLDICKLPPILIIHFKRFYGDSEFSSPVYRKKQTFVHFPLQKFLMDEHVARSEISRNNSIMKHGYHLYGVSNHYGTLERGHYTAYCKNTLQNKWYKFDDQQVLPLDYSDIASSAAYILFYSSLSEQPPSDMR